MLDFKLNNITGDIDLSTGDLQLQGGIRCIAQLIGTRFRFQRGEWFLDTRVGAPIFDGILGSDRGQLDTIRAILNQILIETPGVTEVVSLEFQLGTDRALRVQWQVRADSGEIIANTETLIFGDV